MRTGPADGDTQMGCSGLAPPPARRLRATLAQLPRALCVAAPPTPPPPPFPDPDARGRWRQCCRAQGVMGQWGRAPATFGHAPDGGLRTWRDGSADQHGVSRESDRRFRLLALKGKEGVAYGCSRNPACSSIGQREQRRWSRRRGEERSPGVFQWEERRLSTSHSQPSGMSRPPSSCGWSGHRHCLETVAAPQVAANWDLFSLPPGSGSHRAALFQRPHTLSGSLQRHISFRGFVCCSSCCCSCSLLPISSSYLLPMSPLPWMSSNPKAATHKEAERAYCGRGGQTPAEALRPLDLLPACSSAWPPWLPFLAQPSSLPCTCGDTP